MIEYEWAVYEIHMGECYPAASGSAPSYADALAEMNRYASQYAQDGPIKAELAVRQVLYSCTTERTEAACGS